MTNLKPRWVPAIIGWMPYEDPEDPDQPSYAPYSRLGQCEEHGLERVTGNRTINTGAWDTCWVGVFACGRIAADDVF